MIDFKGKNILLVEDEVLIAMSCERELRSLGYDVTTCFSAEEAISLALDDNRQIDIILMDIDLGRQID
ncbi:MAG TPA: response regulator, partial [Spirochaetota bacterium]|nr:response regulator [Spirochaetota bacterium]